MRFSSIFYRSAGGSVVEIPQGINPFGVLGVDPTTVTPKQLQAAFRKEIQTADRQRRAMVSISYAMANMIVRQAVMTAPFTMTATGKVGFDADDPFVLALIGQTRRLETLIEQDPTLIFRENQFHETLLYVSGRSGYCDTLRMLMTHGVKANLKQSCGSTALHAASYFGHEPVVMHLLSCGADVAAKNNFDRTAADEAKNDAIKQIFRSLSLSLVHNVLSSCAKLTFAGPQIRVEHEGVPIMFRVDRAFDNNALQGWRRVWHGTKQRYMFSIMKNGLRAPGTVVDGVRIEIPAGHIRRNCRVDGISDWAGAIFATPTLTYACHAAYAERIMHSGEQWCCVVEVAVRPGSYSEHPSTVAKYVPLEGEPAAKELRVSEPTDGVSETEANVGTGQSVLRIPDEKNAVVIGACFISLKFVENTTLAHVEVQSLLSSKSV